MAAVERLTYDYETFSKLDLSKVGGYKYASDPSTEILCLGYKCDDNKSRVWFPWQPFPVELAMALNDDETIVVAHNAFFEFCIHNFVLVPYLLKKFGIKIKKLSHARMSCTAARARLLAYPGKLEHLAAALKLPTQKDMEGHRLMKKMMKPRKPTKNDPSTRHNKPEQYRRLGQYCILDLETERHADKAMPELPALERRYWILDQKMNARGVAVDVPSSKNVLKLIREYKFKKNKEIRKITEGRVGSVDEVKALLTEIRNLGIPMKALTKNDVTKAINTLYKKEKKQPLEYEEKTALKLLKFRRSLGKSSTSKYQALIDRACDDGRVRDLWKYCGASTRRWSGQGVQFQNLPRPTKAYKDYSMEEVEALEFADLEYLEALYDDPLAFLSSCIRSMIKVEDGEIMLCADYNAIELRVLMWLVDQKNALEMIRKGEDLYCDTATDIYGRVITKDDWMERFTGKETVLGSGYQMGAPKFRISVFDKTLAMDPDSGGVLLDFNLCKKSIATYRRKFSNVPKFWRDVELAAIKAVKTGERVACKKVVWEVTEGNHLWCILPSGGRLSFPDASVKVKPNRWGTVKPTLYHGGADKSGKYSISSTYGGKLTENIVQGIARDLMAHGMLEAEKQGYEILKTVHDELTSKKKSSGSLEDFERIMNTMPAWAKGLPLKTEGFETIRYRK